MYSLLYDKISYDGLYDELYENKEEIIIKINKDWVSIKKRPKEVVTDYGRSIGSTSYLIGITSLVSSRYTRDLVFIINNKIYSQIRRDVQVVGVVFKDVYCLVTIIIS